MGQGTPLAGSFAQISLGGSFDCGLRTDGTLACWGYNGEGEATPPSGHFSQVCAGANHTCAIKTDGAVACWGYNANGQATPPQGSFAQISAGWQHTCAVKVDGTVACWGYNANGQATPPQGSFAQVSAGYLHTCGLKTDGTVVCWGDASHGEATPSPGAFRQISAGHLHTCGVNTDGTLACWGESTNGQATPPSGVFTVVSGGWLHDCGLKTDGTLVCWGDNTYGQATPPSWWFAPGPTLIGNWTFDEGTGTTVADSSNHGRNGTLQSAVGGNLPTWIADGIHGKALHFDGTGYARLTNTANAFDFGRKGFSVAGWVRYATLPQQSTGADYCFIGKQDSLPYDNGYTFVVDWPPGAPNHLTFYDCNQNTMLVTPRTYDDQQWHFVVGTNDGTTGRLYVDGQLIGAQPGAPGLNSADMLVGGVVFTGAFVDGFIGDIDEVRVYDAPLATDLVQSLYSGYTSGKAPLGNAVQVAPDYAFSLPQGTQQTFSVYLTNISNVQHTATPTVIDPNSQLAVRVGAPGSVTIPPGQVVPTTLVVDASQASVGTYGNIQLDLVLDGSAHLNPSVRVVVLNPAKPLLPDLEVGANDIALASTSGNTVAASVTVHNLGGAASTQTTVQFSDLGVPLGQAATVPPLPPNGVATVSITFSALAPGDHLIEAEVAPISESDTTNNKATTTIHIGPGTLQAGILVTGSLPSTAYAGLVFNLSGLAVYDFMANPPYPVMGGSVQVAITGNSGPGNTYGGFFTSTDGSFAQGILAPSIPSAPETAYSLTITVTDNTFVGTRQLPLVVSPAPDPNAPLSSASVPPEWGTGHYVPASGGTGGSGGSGDSWTWVWDTRLDPPASIPQSDVRVFSEGIHFSNDNPTPGQEITLFAQFQYWASDTSVVAQNVPVNTYIVDSSGQKTRIGQTVLDSLSLATTDTGGRYVFSTWKPATAGAYLVELEIDPSYVEAVTSNNAATRAICAGVCSTPAPVPIPRFASLLLAGLLALAGSVLARKGDRQTW